MANTSKKAQGGAKPYPRAEIYATGKQKTFSGDHLDRVAFPLGGIGAGQVNLGGSGNFRDFSIANRPALGKQPMTFAAIYAKPKGGDSVARLIEGPLTPSRVANGSIGGPGSAGHEGYPHMAAATFRGEFPFAALRFTDPTLPLKVSFEAFSPFVPLDVKHSAMPAGILKYSFANPTKKTVEAFFTFNM